jgi:5-formyltetrahydrofolate cyclo-ligase
VAAARLLDIEAIKVNPDSPQRPLRAEALRRGITVFVPTPRLRGGFKKLDPRRIPPDKIEEAASLSRGEAIKGHGIRPRFVQHEPDLVAIDHHDLFYFLLELRSLLRAGS